jgi:hypothetical protein
VVEVKAVGRTFRVTDLRQGVVYGALAYAAGESVLAGLVLVNPRHGTAIRWRFDDLCYQAAGLPASEVFRAIVDVSVEPDAYIADARR